ncbi:hypothetical protein I553_3640 [Mycobacterium xenopi 4042]|uniref:Uncharacterized protein n=1 Tax=Mycobacterium xenopi 4042 TaxID=1299334 RepID=X7ZDI3_MYCXE|nr:hypothetical protein I553_3640 [Mycobacterium xenopi 4042]
MRLAPRRAARADRAGGGRQAANPVTVEAIERSLDKAPCATTATAISTTT